MTNSLSPMPGRDAFARAVAEACQQYNEDRLCPNGNGGVHGLMKMMLLAHAFVSEARPDVRDDVEPLLKAALIFADKIAAGCSDPLLRALAKPMSAQQKPT